MPLYWQFEPESHYGVAAEESKQDGACTCHYEIFGFDGKDKETQQKLRRIAESVETYHVCNPDCTVQELTADQIRELYLKHFPEFA